ncbi:MAG: hypothetical protein LC117_07105 [Bacteroidia bacterium]|nr:hypothetical protein [Bacteroidia bacterium]MCZ2277679.1 hypothetical protein [Bacteroidia bacterium]
MNFNDRIIELIKVKGLANQQAFTNCRQFFDMIKTELKETEQFLRSSIVATEPTIHIEFEDKGRLEVRFRFANDVLLFFMHTTAVTLDINNPLLKSGYIKEKPSRAMCGLVYVYNFLNDTLKYNRVQDAGELVARIYVNTDNHFMMEGKRQLGIIYNDLTSHIVNPESVKRIIQQLIIHVLEVDPVAQPFDSQPMVSLQQIIETSSPAEIISGRRFGFVIPGSNEDN